MCFGRFEPNSFVENQPDLQEMSVDLIWKMLKVNKFSINPCKINYWVWQFSERDGYQYII